MDISASGITEAEQATVAGNLRAATGGAAQHHALQLMRELTDAACPGGADGAAAAEAAGDEAGAARVVAAIEAAMGLAPCDPLEAMLVAQMAAGHAAAMRCLGRAAECADRPQIEALYLRLAARLMNLFVRQAEALDRRARRPGRTASAAEGAANGTETAAGADAAEPDGAAILDKLIADIHAGWRAEAAQRTEDGDRGSDARGDDFPAPDA
ncbi:MAG: hypothetical protein OEN55_10645 [Alphaproteobacteria bacterium]|nr:hypothetical protein [Alphaproteobacteria bacterium]